MRLLELIDNIAEEPIRFRETGKSVAEKGKEISYGLMDSICMGMETVV